MPIRDTLARYMNENYRDNAAARVQRLVEIAKTGKVSREDLIEFQCKSEDQWRGEMIDLLSNNQSDKKVRALGVALAGVLFPAVERRSLGVRRNEFMKEHQISLSTMIRWERSGADVVASAWPYNDYEQRVETKRYHSGVSDLENGAVEDIGETVDRLRLEVIELKDKLEQRDSLIANMRALLNAPDDRD